MNHKLAFTLYMIVIIVCLVVVFYTLSFMKSEARVCLANPFIYGASKMGNVSCSCFQLTNKMNYPAQFSFNDTSFDASSTKYALRTGEFSLTEQN